MIYINYELRQENDLIYITTFDGITDITTYNDTLYDVLTKFPLSATRNGLRLKFRNSRNGADNRLYLTDIVLACKLGFVKGTDTFLENMREYYLYKSKDNADHADGHILNNTFSNLSLLSEYANKSKSSITVRFAPPDYLFTAVCEDGYLIKFIRLVNRRDRANGEVEPYNINKRYVCKSEYSYISTLKELYFETPTDFRMSLIMKLSEIFNNVSVDSSLTMSPCEHRKSSNGTSSLRELDNAVQIQKNLIQEYLTKPEVWIVRE